MVTETGSSMLLYLSVITVNLAAFTYGLVGAWSSPYIPKLNGSIDPEKNPLPEPINTSQESFLASLMVLGGSISPWIAGYLCHRLGGKTTLLYTTIPVYISFILTSFASNLYVFYLARFLAGLSGGAVYVCVPNYVSEISEKHSRGALSCLLTFSVSLGFFTMYLIGPFLTVFESSLIGLIPPTLLFVLGMFVLPESVYYLLMKNREGEALRALHKLRKKDSIEVTKELDEIKSTVTMALQNKTSASDFFKNKGAYIVVSLAMLQQFSGINVVLFYMQILFSSSGISMNPAYVTMIVGSTPIAATTITPLLVDRLGRRFLLFVSTSGTAVSLFCMSLFFYIKRTSGNIDYVWWMPIVSLIAFFFLYYLGTGPMPFLLMSEILPVNIKAFASSAVISFCFFMAFVLTKIFPDLSQLFGLDVSFLILSGCCVITFVFVYFVVPETKGKNFAEIQMMLNKKT